LKQGKEDKNPSLILEQGIKFKIHSSMPVWIFHNRGIAHWFSERGKTNTIDKESTWKWILKCAISKFFQLGDVIFGLGNHKMGRQGFSGWGRNLSG